MTAILELPTQYWPAAVALVASVLGVLRLFGMLVRPADSGDLKVFQNKLETLEGFHHENREEHGDIRAKNEREHHEIREDIKAMSDVVNRIAVTVAKVEGKMEQPHGKK